MLDACLTKIKFTLYCGYDDIPKIKTVGYLQLSVLSTITLNCNTLFLILYILRRNCITDDWQEAFCCYYVEKTIEESKFVFSVKWYLIWRACLLYSLMSGLSFERQLWPPVDAGKIKQMNEIGKWNTLTLNENLLRRECMIFFSVKIPLFQIFVYYIGRQKLRGLRVLSQTVNGLIEENPLSLRYSNNAHMMMQLK